MMELNPATLIVDANIRKNITLDEDFIESIREHGVLVPILVMKGDGDEFTVLDGQRRTIAAIDTGRALVPVTKVATAAEADRIVQQLVINDQRASIDDTDRNNALIQLDGLGITADQIAKRTRIPKDRITQAIAVARSPFAMQAIETRQISLEHAAALAEFQDDPAAAERLLDAAVAGYGFNHTLATVREETETAAAIAHMIGELRIAGRTIVEELDDARHYLLTELETAKGGAVMIPNAKGKGLVVHVTTERKWNPSLTRYEAIPTAVRYIEDPETHGWVIKSQHKGTPGGLTDEQKAERKTTRDNNKAWPTATEVRHAWIKDELLTRTSIPTGIYRFLALAMAHGFPQDGYSTGSTLAADWLGIKTEGWDYHPLVSRIEAHPGEASTIALALAIARTEANIDGKEGWQLRGDSTSDLPRMVRYLQFLGSWGYQFSTVESYLIEKARASDAAKATA